MNPLDKIKQKLMIKPSVKERERVAVVINAEETVKPYKKQSEKDENNKEKTEKREKRVLEEGEEEDEEQEIENEMYDITGYRGEDYANGVYYDDDRDENVFNEDE